MVLKEFTRHQKFVFIAIHIWFAATILSERWTSGRLNPITNLSSSLFNMDWMLMRWRKSRLIVLWRGLWVPKHPSL